MVARTKAKAKATVTDVPFAETVEPMHVTPVTWQRKVTAWVVTLLTSCGLGYLAGQVLGYLTLAAALMTGSLFIAAVVYTLGLIASCVVGYKVGPIVYASVVERKIENFFSGLFSGSTLKGATA